MARNRGTSPAVVFASYYLMQKLAAGAAADRPAVARDHDCGNRRDDLSIIQG